MAFVVEPLLLTFSGVLLAIAPAAATLALIFSFQTGNDNDYFYLNGVKGSLFLLLASLSLLAGALTYKTIKKLLLYLYAWRVTKRADLLRSSHASASQTTILDSHERIYICNDAIAFLNGRGASARRAWENARRQDSGTTRSTLIIASILDALLVIVLALLLAAVVWLHIAIQIDNIAIEPGLAIASTGQAYGRALSASCTQGTSQSGSWQIAFNSGFCNNRLDLVQNDTEAYSTLDGISSINSIATIARAYNGQDVSVMANAGGASSPTYAASSYGITTQCQPMPKGCDFNATTGQYSCHGTSFAGYLTQSPFFSTPVMSSGLTTFFVGALLSSSGSSFGQSLRGPSTLLSSDDSNLFMALSCNAQALQVSYIMQSGTSKSQSVKVADDETQWLMLAPMFPGQITGYNTFGATQLVASAEAAASSASVQSPQDLANAFASTFARAAISSSASILVPSNSQSPASGSSSNGSTTLLPKTPILMMIALNLVIALLIVISGVWAIVLTVRDSRVHQLKSLLTYQGALAAAAPQDHNNEGGNADFPRNESVATTDKPFSRCTGKSRTSDEANNIAARDFDGQMASDSIAMRERPTIGSKSSMRPRSEKVIGEIEQYG